MTRTLSGRRLERPAADDDFKSNHAMKYGQLIEYNKINNFLHRENEAGRIVSDLFLFSKKALYEVKPNGLQLNFIRLAQF